MTEAEETFLETTPDIGHNKPPEDGDIRGQLEARRDAIAEVMDKWLEAEDRQTIREPEIAEKLNAFVNEVAAWEKKSEAARKEEKAPILDQGRAIDGYYKDLPGPLTKGLKILKSRLADYLKFKREKEQEEARKKAEEARKAREEEERLKAEAEKEANLEAIQKAEEAEEARKQAEHQQREAEKEAKKGVKGAEGDGSRGLRKTKRAEIRDVEAALFHFSDHPGIIAALQQVADATAKSVPMSKAEAGMELAPGVFMVITESV